ncbi:Kinesin-related protein 12 [Batrachochytrium dendrobatidis]|nr:Kinesin-related protein 12 [Batrachochytrium dendrobatidis]
MLYNRVFDEETGQKEFFLQSGIQELVTQAINGYSATIFAFGQTGSGKTFTITGPEGAQTSDTVGIVPRALNFLFEKINAMRSSTQLESIRIQASYLEIYNEHVQDLLNPHNSALPVRWSADRGFYVENLYIVDCDGLDDSLAVLEEGLRNRTVASHDMNEHSSRSHSVLTIYLETQNKDDSMGRTVKCHGKISFVDLAGSEKVKESKAAGDTFAEALSINKSLLNLGICISALSDPKKRNGHIPFRDSKLTKLLADSLGGHGVTLMIACISPGSLNIQETNKTLRYASKACKIQTKLVLQLDPREEILLILKREIMGLRRENLMLRGVIDRDPKHAMSGLATKDVMDREHLEGLIARARSTRNPSHFESGYSNRQSANVHPVSSTIHQTAAEEFDAKAMHERNHFVYSQSNPASVKPSITTNAKEYKRTIGDAMEFHDTNDYQGRVQMGRRSAMSTRQTTRSTRSSGGFKTDGHFRSTSAHESRPSTMATERVHSLKWSNTPAGHEHVVSQKDTIKRSGNANPATKSASQKLAPTKLPSINTKAKPKPPSVSTSPVKLAQIQQTHSDRNKEKSAQKKSKSDPKQTASPAKNNIKRPSNREHPPIAKNREEFTLLQSNDGYIADQKPLKPVPVDMVLEAVNNRHQLLSDVHALDNEISRMSVLNR